MNARDRLNGLLHQYHLTGWTELVDAVIAERDAQIVAWLVKKAGEYGYSNREKRAQADAVSCMASKLSRGAVRDTEAGLSELARLNARVDELEAERHSTNEALSDAVKALRVQRDRIAELETLLSDLSEPDVDGAGRTYAEYHPEGDPIAYGPTGIRCGCGKPAHSNLVPCRQPEDAHASPLHHDYAVPRDLPTVPRQTTGRCPNGHTFEDCTCGGAA